MLLRALMNAGMPETIPTLLTMAETSKDNVVSETAVKALRRMGADNLRREEVGTVFLLRFPQEKFHENKITVVLVDSRCSVTEIVRSMIIYEKQVKNLLRPI